MDKLVGFLSSFVVAALWPESAAAWMAFLVPLGTALLGGGTVAAAGTTAALVAGTVGTLAVATTVGGLATSIYGAVQSSKGVDLPATKANPEDAQKAEQAQRRRFERTREQQSVFAGETARLGIGTTLVTGREGLGPTENILPTEEAMV
tara:strand:+ start:2988 stop:3434 length:447 start_codon:yes stop_codon:yes gene_type:complete